jgi:hypothetical protein
MLKYPLEVLHVGFDGLDVSFNGCLCKNDLDTLEEAKNRATKEMRPIPVTIGPGHCELLISESGARGGYKFSGDTGFLGENWWFKNRPTPEAGNIRTSLKSASLAVYGYEGARARLSSKLSAMGAVVNNESIGRVDYCLDLRLPSDFQLHPDFFVSHSRSTLSEHCEPPCMESNFEKSFEVHWSGRKATGVTIGKMPGRQIVVYNKRKEIISKQKFEWFKIWNISPDDSNFSIWRIEVRFGKQYLNETLRVKTYAELSRCLKPAVLKALNDIRYLASKPIGNVTRCVDHEIWQFARLSFCERMAEPLSKIDTAELINDEKNRIIERRFKMIKSLIPGALAASSGSIEAAVADAPRFLRSISREILSNRDQLAENVERATLRLAFRFSGT